jgi:hypothetical protein
MSLTKRSAFSSPVKVPMPINFVVSNVRYGSLADIGDQISHVRFAS